jgi:hypothetical protein
MLSRCRVNSKLSAGNSVDQSVAASRIAGMFFGGVAALSLGAASDTALAHDAGSGWKYPISCCSGYDCREVSTKLVKEQPEGYVISTTGEVIGYGDKRVKISEDQEYHWCSIGGTDTGSTICLFVPPRFF